LEVYQGVYYNNKVTNETIVKKDMFELEKDTRR